MTDDRAGGEIVRCWIDSSASTGECERYQCEDGSEWQRLAFRPAEKRTGIRYGRLNGTRIDIED